MSQQSVAAATNTDANGKLVVAGNGAMISARITSVDGVGNATLLLSDAYDTLTSQRTSITVPCYTIREQNPVTA